MYIHARTIYHEHDPRASLCASHVHEHHFISEVVRSGNNVEVELVKLVQ
jgi:hypothetical protein